MKLIWRKFVSQLSGKIGRKVFNYYAPKGSELSRIKQILFELSVEGQEEP